MGGAAAPARSARGSLHRLSRQLTCGHLPVPPVHSRRGRKRKTKRAPSSGTGMAEGAGRGGGHAPRGQAPSAPMARPVARFSLLDKTHKRKPALPPRSSTPPLVSGRARRPAAVTSVFRRTRGGLGRCWPPLGLSRRSWCLPHGAHLAAWPRVGSPCSGTPHDGLGQAAAGVQNGDRSVHVRPRPRRGPGLTPKLRRAPGELARVFRARHALAPRGCAPALRHDAADRQAAGGASAGRANTPAAGCEEGPRRGRRRGAEGQPGPRVANGLGPLHNCGLYPGKTGSAPQKAPRGDVWLSGTAGQEPSQASPSAQTGGSLGHGGRGEVTGDTARLRYTEWRVKRAFGVPV